jgi:hypothetical protein
VQGVEVAAIGEQLGQFRRHVPIAGVGESPPGQGGLRGEVSERPADLLHRITLVIAPLVGLDAVEEGLVTIRSASRPWRSSAVIP